MLRIYGGVDDNQHLFATYVLTDDTVRGPSTISNALRRNLSMREMQSVVEAVDARVQDAAALSDARHRISKRSATVSVGRDVRCYRVLNFARRDAGDWLPIKGKRI